jgi:hypothetical protein
MNVFYLLFFIIPATINDISFAEVTFRSKIIDIVAAMALAMGNAGLILLCAKNVTI